MPLEPNPNQGPTSADYAEMAQSYAAVPPQRSERRGEPGIAESAKHTGMYAEHERVALTRELRTEELSAGDSAATRSSSPPKTAAPSPW